MGFIYPEEPIVSVKKEFTIEEAKVLVNAIDLGKSFNECVGLLGPEANGDNVINHYNSILAEKSALSNINPYDCENEADYLNKLRQLAVYLDADKWYLDIKTAYNVNDFADLKAKFEPIQWN